MTDNEYELRAEWLAEHGRVEGDVMSDDQGDYIMDEPTLMDEGEEESGKLVKVYLPEFHA